MLSFLLRAHCVLYLKRQQFCQINISLLRAVVAKLSNQCLSILLTEII